MAKKSREGLTLPLGRSSVVDSRGREVVITIETSLKSRKGRLGPVS